MNGTLIKVASHSAHHRHDYSLLKSVIMSSFSYVSATSIVVLATAISLLLTRFLTHQNMIMIYILAVTFVATRYSMGPSFVCWLFSVLSYSYFIAPPRYAFWVSDWHYLLTFAAVLLLVIIMSRRTSLIKMYANELEMRVVERTKELTRTNENLRAEIAQRRMVEGNLKRLVHELSAANRALEEFAKMASHDLREPLKAIQGYVELIERRYYKILSHEVMQFISCIQDCAERMDHLVRGLHACVQMEAKNNKFTPCDLRQIVNEAIANLNVTIVENKVSIIVDPLPVLMADSSQLVHLFQNLISNAIKFRRDDIPEIRISACRQKHEWIFSVSDNGIGIEGKYCQQIFGMFQRLHSRAQYPGSGIGLAICKIIVENHGGKIWVESALGVGSTFKFSFLVEDIDDGNNCKNI